MSVASSLLYCAVYLTSWILLRSADPSAEPDTAPRPSRWGAALWCAVAVPSLLQLLAPGLLSAGRRDPAAIAGGEVWRLVTSMFLQDGGWLGTAFNLVTLAVTVAAVRFLLDGPRLVALFLVGGIVGNLLTLVLLGASGAGSSMATMFVAASAAVATGPWRERRNAAVLAGLVGTAVVLSALADQHGFVTVGGLAAGLVVGPAADDSVSGD